MEFSKFSQKDIDQCSNSNMAICYYQHLDSNGAKKLYLDLISASKHSMAASKQDISVLPTLSARQEQDGRH